MARHRTNWHRIFGLILSEYLEERGFRVEVELDLSMKRQLLDVAVIKKAHEVKLQGICDGFEDFGDYNLVTFKSLRESLTEWSIHELIGHYVNYCKVNKIKDHSKVHLYAVSTIYPEKVFFSRPRRKPMGFIRFGLEGKRFESLCPRRRMSL